MSNTVYLGRNIKGFDSSPQFDGYSKVIITVSDEIEYSAGTDLGRTLRVTNPWGTPQMAEDILADIRGFQYQPYTAEDARLDPAAELGDGITANNVYSGIYTQNIKFGRMLTAKVSAPEDEELNHEYPYQSKPNKEITREAKMLRAEMRIQTDRIELEVIERKNAVNDINSKLSVQADLISAKVSKTGGNASSFGWDLTDSSWTIKANNRAILKATVNGLEVYGKITATSGKIGGFDIQSNYLSYNNQTWGGTNTTGVYIGPSGIQLGKYFKVDANGNLTATNGTFTGSINAGNIRYGGDYGTFSGSGISSHSLSGNRLQYNTVGTSYVSGGINTSLGYADFSHDVFNGNDTASNLYARSVTVTSGLYIPSGGGTRKVSVTTVTINGYVYNILTV